MTCRKSRKEQTFPYGPKSFDQATRAKKTLHDSLPRVAGVSLFVTIDLQEMTNGVSARYDAADPVQAAWVCEAERKAPHVRELVSGMDMRGLGR